MAKYEVRVRYAFEGTYKVVAEDRDEAERIVTEDCGLVLGGNIHTTRDDDEVTDWRFGSHPDMQILSFRGRVGKGKVRYTSMCFSDRIEELRKDIIEAIRQLLDAHGLKKITFTDNEKDPVWIIWFDDNAEPYECYVTGIEVTDKHITVLATIKDSMEEVFCQSPFELGASNIDWLNQMYEAVRLQLEIQKETLETKDNMATKINMDRYVWEGWTVGAFIRELAPQVEMIMSGQSWREPFRNKQELADWCRDNQPYYKKRIPEVNSYFARMYNLK